jgi:hypothetical protein
VKLVLLKSALGALIICFLPFVTSARDSDDVVTNYLQADSLVGERLFFETRFSQYFNQNNEGDVNFPLSVNDPVMTNLQTVAGPVPGPFATPALGGMNCRQCHLVDEEGYGTFGNHTLGNRTYADFARRSPVPIPNVPDGRTQTARNAPLLVESLAASQNPPFIQPGFLYSPTSNFDTLLPGQPPLLLHHDGQFASAHDLIIGTLTGRNFGWQPDEYGDAVANIAAVIRYDDGTGYLATQERAGEFSPILSGLGSYAQIFAGYDGYYGDPRFIDRFLISPELRIDVTDTNTTDEEIVDTVAALIQVYLESLTFSRDTNNLFNGSPYDVFLIKNGLPRQSATNETALDYSQRLLRRVSELPYPLYVTDPADGHFTTHDQLFQFGTNELEGLKIFLTLNDRRPEGRGHEPPFRRGRPGRAGNCAACHQPPAFTDFLFHNTGATQEEYDAIHGAGSFFTVPVPDLATRQSNYDAYLPPTTNHPQATGFFETPPSTNAPGAVDLGLWNVYANPDFPAPQPGLCRILPQMLGVPAPQIDTATLRGQRFACRGHQGTPGATYFVQVAASPQGPPAQWQTIATNSFDGFGEFAFDVAAASNMPAAFYRVTVALPPPAAILPLTLARFKTSTMRDLGQSDPYLHTGRMDTIEDVIQFYQNFSELARRGQVRNADPQLSGIDVDDSAVAPLAAFLRALNEDYTD